MEKMTIEDYLKKADVSASNCSSGHAALTYALIALVMAIQENGAQKGTEREETGDTKRQRSDLDLGKIIENLNL